MLVLHVPSCVFFLSPFDSLVHVKQSGGCWRRGPRWLEADIDMDSSGLANHVVALVKGVTTSQTIDMAIVLQVSFLPSYILLQLPTL